MISEPAAMPSNYVAAGADAITFHVEAVDDPAAAAGEVARAWASWPDWPTTRPRRSRRSVRYLDACDLVLTMSVVARLRRAGVRASRPGQACSWLALRMVARRAAGGRRRRQCLDHWRLCRGRRALFVVGSAIFGQDDYSPKRRLRLTQLAQTHARTH